MDVPPQEFMENALYQAPNHQSRYITIPSHDIMANLRYPTKRKLKLPFQDWYPMFCCWFPKIPSPCPHDLSINAPGPPSGPREPSGDDILCGLLAIVNQPYGLTFNTNDSKTHTHIYILCVYIYLYKNLHTVYKKKLGVVNYCYTIALQTLWWMNSIVKLWNDWILRYEAFWRKSIPNSEIWSILKET